MDIQVSHTCEGVIAEVAMDILRGADCLLFTLLLRVLGSKDCGILFLFFSNVLTVERRGMIF